MVELLFLVQEIRVQIQLTTDIKFKLTTWVILYKNKKLAIALASNYDPAIAGILVGGDK